MTSAISGGRERHGSEVVIYMSKIAMRLVDPSLLDGVE